MVHSVMQKFDKLAIKLPISLIVNPFSFENISTRVIDCCIT